VKNLEEIRFDPAVCRAELDAFRELLSSKAELSERDDIQPFFRANRQFTAFIGSRIPDIGPANRLAYEFPIFGDFTADIVIGNFEQKTFCAIELEDARPNSVFDRSVRRATSEWGRRLEHGFGQLVDWFWAFDDHKKTDSFAKHFGYGHIEFFGMLIVGRSRDVAEHDRNRLSWRSGRVSINTHKVYCRTFDELYKSLDEQWQVMSETRASLTTRTSADGV
jgi:hypothetical protein